MASSTDRWPGRRVAHSVPCRIPGSGRVVGMPPVAVVSAMPHLAVVVVEGWLVVLRVRGVVVAAAAAAAVVGDSGHR